MIARLEVKRLRFAVGAQRDEVGFAARWNAVDDWVADLAHNRVERVRCVVGNLVRLFHLGGQLANLGNQSGLVFF